MESEGKESLGFQDLLALSVKKSPLEATLESPDDDAMETVAKFQQEFGDEALPLQQEDLVEESADDSYEEGLLLTMKKAMMCVREIVRTERSYLAHLMSAQEREVSRYQTSEVGERRLTPDAVVFPQIDSPALLPFFVQLPDLIAASSALS